MMMQAARRTSGLPSLSIAVPPPSTSVVAVRADGASAKPRSPAPSIALVKDTAERAKTVTFSYTEEEDEQEDGLSDQSSICQSPSWAVYGQKKKKDKKREAATKKREQENLEKAGDNSKKKRLSKVPPQGNPGYRPLRPLSASQLEQQSKLSDRNHQRSASHYPPDSMTKNHNLLKLPQQEEPTKPQSKGIFSSFRLSRSNTDIVMKAASSGRSSADDTSSNRGGSAPSVQMQGNMDFLNPRKPPSIKSTQSSSTQSQSSQERQAGKPRKSFTHGRSISLLAKLRGPSYLYAKSSDPDGDAISQQPEGYGHIEATPEQRVEEQDVPHAISTFSPFQRPDDVPMGIPRGRQTLAHVFQSRDSSSDYDDTVAPGARHSLIMQSIPYIPVANEGRRRPPTSGQHDRFQHQDSVVPESKHQHHDYDGYHDDQIQETRRQPSVSQPYIPVYPQVAVLDQPTPVMSPDSDKSYAAVYTDAVEQLSETLSPSSEVELPTVPDHRVITRSRSADGKPDIIDTSRELPIPDGPRVPASNLRVSSHRGASQDSVSRTKASQKKLRPSNYGSQLLDESTTRPVPPHSVSANYFTFVSEPYAPPTLELVSPIENDYQFSQESGHVSADDMFEDDDPVWAGLPLQTLDLKTEDSVDPVGNPHEALSEQSQTFDFCDSPTLSAHDSDGYVPPFDRTEASSTVDKYLLKTPTFGTALEAAQSRSTSERSSSSTGNEAFRSPSTATTPDVSRPQSQRGESTDVLRVLTVVSKCDTEKPARGLPRARVLDFPTSGSSRRTLSSQDAADSANTSNASGQHTGNMSSAEWGSTASSPKLVADIGFAATDNVGQDVTSLPRRQHTEPKTQSSVDLPSTGVPHAWRKEPLMRQNKAALSSASLPNPLSPNLEGDIPPPRRFAVKVPRTDSSTSQESLSAPSAGAAYLQEARKAAPIAPAPPSRALRPAYPPRPSLSHLRSSQSSESRGDPIAKVLVQCCNCQFFHDMPSKVYECMAKPDSIVEDKRLGVSAAIATTVKCPWCVHGMTTQCCSGYAAMVYLKEKLHGK